jgi:hypothetical protein
MFNSDNPPTDPKPLGAIAVIGASTAALSLVSGLFMKALASYGWGLFIGLPVLVGFLPVAALRFVGARTRRESILVALSTTTLLFLELVFLGWEGLICIALALPLLLPLIILGAFLAHAMFHARALRPSGPGAAAVLAVVGLAAAESRGTEPGPVFVAADSILIQAAPERVWREMVDLKSVPPPSSLLLRTGLACPQTVRIPRPGAGGTRLCTLSTGQVLERIDVWEPGRRLRWQAPSTPPPMREVNPFHAVDAAHLHGYFDAFQGEFVLERTASGATRLTRRTWYRHNLQPAGYWKFWCDLAATEAHGLVLQEIRRLAESRQEGS